MRSPIISAMAVSVALAAGLAPDRSTAASLFDGRWSVVLVCADTTDRTGFVKGYRYAFAVSVRDGVLRGEYGAPGRPASVTWEGSVGDDGLLEIAANGNTGKSEYSVGKVAQGTKYGYTMQGRLTGTSGQAERREIRPCTATFDRSSSVDGSIPPPVPADR